jgi:hypothetical protein
MPLDESEQKLFPSASEDRGRRRVPETVLIFLINDKNVGIVCRHHEFAGRLPHFEDRVQDLGSVCLELLSFHDTFRVDGAEDTAYVNAAGLEGRQLLPNLSQPSQKYGKFDRTRDRPIKALEGVEFLQCEKNSVDIQSPPVGDHIVAI